MTNFNRIQEINNQCMKNIEMIMNDSKNILKNFKMQQAEVMKNIMVSTDESSDLEQQFRTFQNELRQREQEQYNQINGRISNEIDNMKRIILQELSSPSVSMYTPSSNSMMNNYTNSLPNTNSTMDLNSYAPTTPSNMNSMSPRQDNSMSQQMGSPAIEQSFSDSMLGDLESFTNNSQQSSPMSMPGNMPQGNNGGDIPVETKELDEWISEIKNLI